MMPPKTPPEPAGFQPGMMHCGKLPQESAIISCARAFCTPRKGPIDAWEPYLEPADATGADDATAASMDFTIFFSNTLNQIARA